VPTVFTLVDGDPQASPARYQITEDRGFRPLKLVVREKLGRPFRMTLDVEFDPAAQGATRPECDPVGTPISIQVNGLSRKNQIDQTHASPGRLLHGWIRRFERTGVAGGSTEQYRVRIGSGLWPLSRNLNSRVFHDRSIYDIAKFIVQQVPGLVSLDGTLVASAPSGRQAMYVKREQVVQYRESDLDFMHRLLELEGLTYYFAHGPNGHTLVLADAATSYPWFASQRAYDPSVTPDDSTPVGPGNQEGTGLDLLEMSTITPERPERILSFAQRQTAEDYPNASTGTVVRQRPETNVLRGYEYNNADDSSGAVAGIRSFDHSSVKGLEQVTDAGAIEPGMYDDPSNGSAPIERFDHPSEIGNVSQAGGQGAYGAAPSTVAESDVAYHAEMLARVRTEARFWPKRIAKVQASGRALRAGSIFTAQLESTPVVPNGNPIDIAALYNPPANVGSYLIVASESVYYAAGDEDDQTKPAPCRVDLRAIPVGVPFRPTQRTEKPQILGAQTAIVVNSDGESDPDFDPEFDSQGRITVKFHWARDGQVPAPAGASPAPAAPPAAVQPPPGAPPPPGPGPWLWMHAAVPTSQNLGFWYRAAVPSGPTPLAADAQAAEEGQYTAKVRVSQPLSGAGHGSTFVPRIGREVVVQFIDGDPDRPLVTGMVYNAEDNVPSTLNHDGVDDNRVWDPTYTIIRDYNSNEIGMDGQNQTVFLSGKAGDSHLFVGGSWAGKKKDQLWWGGTSTSDSSFTGIGMVTTDDIYMWADGSKKEYTTGSSSTYVLGTSHKFTLAASTHLQASATLDLYGGVAMKFGLGASMTGMVNLLTIEGTYTLVKLGITKTQFDWTYKDGDAGTAVRGKITQLADKDVHLSSLKEVNIFGGIPGAPAGPASPPGSTAVQALKSFANGMKSYLGTAQAKKAQHLNAGQQTLASYLRLNSQQSILASGGSRIIVKNNGDIWIARQGSGSVKVQSSGILISGTKITVEGALEVDGPITTKGKEVATVAPPKPPKPNPPQKASGK